MIRDNSFDSACELGEPSAPKPGKRRSGVLTPGPLHASVIESLVETHGPQRAVVEAFKLGQSIGHGRMGSLLGCKSCGKKAVAIVAQKRVCLLCGNRPR